MRKTLISTTIIAGFLLPCNASFAALFLEKENPSSEKSIVVLYENDVHCGVAGYTKIAGLRNAINESDTAQCIIVSSGDYLQGGTWGALSSGEYIMNLMNSVGYSAVTIGNHEFDYGCNRLLYLMGKMNMPVTCVNFCKYGSDEQFCKPYVMTEVAGKKLAFVGVVTPTTLATEYYAFYDKDKNKVYDLCDQNYQNLAQKAVNDARTAGADYVFLLSHLGEDDNGYSSILMINNTSGIDLVLDGHTHSVIPDSSAVNKDGKPVHFTQTGTQFANIGKLTISKSGTLHTELLPTSTLTYADSKVDAVTDSIKKLVSAVTSEVLGTTDHKLAIYDDSGTRLVRNQECTAGDFTADAYRYAMQAEIGLVNGGGVRNDIPAGNITYGEIVNMTPFFNDMEARELTGRQLLSLLNSCCSSFPAEDGRFLQVSGLKVTISSTGGTPTVTEVQVEDKKTGIYHPLELDRKYVVGSISYVFGMQSELADCKVVTPEIMKDTEAQKKYLVEGLHGDIGAKYSATEGRITFTE